MKLPLPYTKNKKDHFFQRLFEILPGSLTWLTFILMIGLSIIKPVWIAIFIICFDVYWICKGLFIAIHIWRGYSLMKRNIAVNWLDRCKGVSADFDKYLDKRRKELKAFDKCIAKGNTPKICQVNNSNIIRLKKNLSAKKQRSILLKHLDELEEVNRDSNRKKNILNWKEIEHVVIIPTYKEPIEVLEGNINAIYRNNYPRNKFHIFVGFEETAKKAGDDVEGKREKLEKKYKGKFAHFETFVHPILSNEQPGKGANATYVTKKAKKYIDRKGFDYKKVILSPFDSEAYAHEEYFACVTYYFITSKNRCHQAYQPLPFYSNTIWYAPAYSRIISMGSTFWHMVESVRSERLVTFSNQSHSFQAIYDADYWPVNYVVNDDSVIFWRCYFKYDGDYSTLPVYIPVSQDAVYAGKFWSTFKASYLQRRRWAYGIEHFPPIMRAYLKAKKISLFEKFRHIFILLEGAHSLATNAIMIAVLGWLPLILGGSEFNQAVVSRNLPRLTRILMTSSMVFLLVSVYLGFILVPKRPKKIPRWKNFGFIYQWILTIVMATILGAIPAIEAQTRLMLGKYLGFNVTPKKREK